MKHLIFSLTILLFVSCKCVILPCHKSSKLSVLRELSIGESDTVEICSINPKNKTGILIKKESVYSFEVTPQNQRWKDSYLPGFTANGRLSPHFTFFHLLKRTIGAKWFSLIGSIDDKRSTYFKIGISKKSYTSEVDGELVCFANDVRNEKRYANNKGALKLIVTRIK